MHFSVLDSEEKLHNLLRRKTVVLKTVNIEKKQDVVKETGNKFTNFLFFQILQN